MYTVTFSWVESANFYVSACLLSMYQETFLHSMFLSPCVELSSQMYFHVISFPLCFWLSAVGIHLTNHKVLNRRNHFSTKSRSSFRTCSGALHLSIGGLWDICLEKIDSSWIWDWFRSESFRICQEGRCCSSVCRPKLEGTLRNFHPLNLIITWKTGRTARRTQPEVPAYWTMKD